MNPFRLCKPRPTISDRELNTGLRWLTLEGTVSLGFNSITTGVVEASSQAGVDPMNGILGASQGIIQGAAETGIDLSEATLQTMNAAREVADEVGLSEEAAVAQAVEGVLLAAGTIGPEAAAEVVESLPEGILELDKREEGHDE